MSEWKDKSDFEINKAVANFIGVEVSANQYQNYGDRDENVVLVNIFTESDSAVDYCNNPSDAWPIIVKNKISVTHHDGVWMANNFDPSKTAGFQVQRFFYDKNPLRAAMIVYLEMNGVKP